MHSPWPIPTEYAEEGRYNTLLQISIGQEEVDDVITRDIHRTFPEHPQFGAAKGQQLLFKVLKAYSLHDLEVRTMPAPKQRCNSGGTAVGVALQLHGVCKCIDTVVRDALRKTRLMLLLMGPIAAATQLSTKLERHSTTAEARLVHRLACCCVCMR